MLILIGGRLRLSQGLGSNDIELHVVGIHSEVASDELAQVLNPTLAHNQFVPTAWAPLTS